MANRPDFRQAATETLAVGDRLKVSKAFLDIMLRALKAWEPSDDAIDLRVVGISRGMRGYVDLEVKFEAEFQRDLRRESGE